MKTKRNKLNSYGFSHIEMTIALVVIIAIAGVGFFVYKHHQNSNKSMKSTNMMGTTLNHVKESPVKGSLIKVGGKTLGSIVPNASALNLTLLANYLGVWKIYACKTSFPNGLINIQAYYWKDAGIKGIATLSERTFGNKLEQHKTSTAFFDNVVTTISTNVSASEPYSTVFFIVGETGANSKYQVQDDEFVANINSSFLANC